MNIKRKVTLAVMGMAAIPLLAASILLSYTATLSSNAALEQAAKNQLTAIRDTKKTQIEDYFGTIQNQVLTFSNNQMVIDAAQQFAAAFKTIPNVEPHAAQQELEGYYYNEFAPKYQQENSGDRTDVTNLMSRLGDEALYWQLQYIQRNPSPLGSKHLMEQAKDGSDYSSIHQQYHPQFRDYLEKFGYYDIFLVEPDSGDVIYSVFKELDYATSLKNGPYANSGIAKAYRKALTLGRKESVALVDFEPYLPSYEAQASFIASPIFNQSSLVGILIFQMPIGRLNELMTNHQNWNEMGLGKSGETYLVGSDFMARSLSRFLLEDKPHYLEAVAATGVEPHTLELIDVKNSNIGLQRIQTPGTVAAVAGEIGFSIFPDYRNVPVLSAYTPLNIPGLNWVLMSEIDEAEAFASVYVLQQEVAKNSIIIFLVLVVLAALAGLWIANSLTRPMIRLSRIIGQVEESNNLTLRSHINSKDEIGEMATAFNSMMVKFEGVIRDVADSTHLVASASEQLTVAANESAQSLEEQKAETDQIATGMHEMSLTVQEVAGSSQNAAQAAEGSSKQVHSGKDVVAQTTVAIQNLSGDVQLADDVIRNLANESQNIGSITDVIMNIAEQTNLLALNAAIEAARAGDQGRGFAVVADEVRTLAKRTQESIHEIEETVKRLLSGSSEAVEAMQNSQQKAKQGVELVEQASVALDAIVESTQQLSELNAQIASATEQQSLTANDMSRSVDNIRDVANRTATSSEESAASSRELARLSSQLQNMVDQFKVS